MNLFGYVIEKYNPAQPGISADSGPAEPDNIIDYQRAYQEIEIINRAIEMIVSACTEVPFLVEGGPEKKLHKLLNVEPNRFIDRDRFFRQLFLDYYLDGNAFIFYDSEAKGGELHILPANDITVIPDPKTFVKEYHYKKTQVDEIWGRTKNKTDTVIFKPNEVIHIKADSENDLYRGDSKLKSLNRMIELYYSMISFQRQFFKNNCIPGFVLTTNNVLSKKVKDRLLNDWRHNYRTIFKGARNPAILDGGLKVDHFSEVSFKELDFEQSIERIQIDMAKSLGVPYVLMKSGNNANIGNNQTLFFTQTILPVLNSFSSALAHRFGAKIIPDKHSVTALRPDAKSQANFYSTLVNSGIITPNEAREGLRFTPLKDGNSDDIRIPQNIAGSAVDPSQGGSEEDD